MASTIPLFVKDDDGLLHQVASDAVAAVKAVRGVRHINMVAEIALTDAELAEADERAKRMAQNREQHRKTEELIQHRRDVAIEKLKALGFTDEDISALLDK